LELIDSDFSAVLNQTTNVLSLFMAHNGGGMLRAAFWNCVTFCLYELNRNYEPCKLLVTADWNIPLVVGSYSFSCSFIKSNARLK
jgi:hypothetical protein